MIRTCDLCLRRAALYPLSYGRFGKQCSRVVRRSAAAADMRGCGSQAFHGGTPKEVVMAAKRPDFFRQGALYPLSYGRGSA
jgi:hypothetical protein